MMIPKTKIYYESLNVYITRRCNLKCEFCGMGDALNQDLPYERIDWTLDRTSGIEQLCFLGGEPTLNIPGICYMLDGLKKRSIPIRMVTIITNGTCVNDEFHKLITDLDEYVRLFSNIEKPVCIAVSVDEYHDKWTNCVSNLYRMKSHFSEICTVARWTTDIEKIGKAKNLSNSISKPYAEKHKISYFTKEEKDFPCVYRLTYQNVDDNEIVFVCQMALDYKGIFLDSDLPIEDGSPVFKFCETDLLQAIKKYNKGKPFCTIKRHLFSASELIKEYNNALSQQRENRVYSPTKDNEILSKRDEAEKNGKYVHPNGIISTDVVVVDQYKKTDGNEFVNAAIDLGIIELHDIQKLYEKVTKNIALLKISNMGDNLMVNGGLSTLLEKMKEIT